MDEALLPILVAVLGCLPVLLLIFYIRCSSAYRVLKRNGINGPPPEFFFGHYRERIKYGFVDYLKKLRQEYGTIVGIYLGKDPQVVTTDLELIKLITVKDFDNFIDRMRIPDSMNMVKGGLLQATGETWRASRQITSPTFSTFKMKMIAPIIQRGVASLVEVFQKHADRDTGFEAFKIYGAFTMESIVAAAFGREIEIQKGQSDELTKAASVIVGSIRERELASLPAMMMILSNFPWLDPVLKLLTKNSPRQKACDVISEASIEVVRERRMKKDQEKHKDLLQALVDASVEEGESIGGKKRLTDQEIVGNAVTFMLGGYETTANALSYTSYLLALHPHVQEKLQQEIDDYFEENPEVTPYQAAQDLAYLDMVLHEALRLYPPVPIYGRLCAKEYRYKNITIPKNCIITVPSVVLHVDPQYWKDPEVFDPMRFTAEEKAKRPPLSYMPFGNGPRSCIGMRFALLEAKMALLEVLKRFSFIRTPETEVPLMTELGFTMASKNGIHLKAVSRDKSPTSKSSTI